MAAVFTSRVRLAYSGGAVVMRAEYVDPMDESDAKAINAEEPPQMEEVSIAFSTDVARALYVGLGAMLAEIDGALSRPIETHAAPPRLN